MRLYTTADLEAISANLLKRSFSANIMRIAPNGTAMLLALSGMARERKIGGKSHSYWTKTAEYPSVTLNAAFAVGNETALTTDDNSQLVPGTILQAFPASILSGTYATPELIRVTSVNANGTDFVVLRHCEDVAGGSGIALADNQVLIEVGSSYEEGSAKPVARSIAPAEHTNFTQIFRNTWDLTETAAAVGFEPNMTQLAENKEDGAMFHATAMEWSMIFGKKGTGESINGRPIRFMDGIQNIVAEFAPGNLVAAGSTTTYLQLEAFLAPTKDFIVNGKSPGNKTIYCGRTAFKVIQEIGRLSGFFELERNMTSFGVLFSTFITGTGTWELIEHQLFNTNETTKKMAMIADTDSFDVQWLRSTNHKDVAYDGTDAVSGVFTSEMTIEMGNPLGWGFIYNLTAGAA